MFAQLGEVTPFAIMIRPQIHKVIGEVGAFVDEQDLRRSALAHLMAQDPNDVPASQAWQ